jgi:hypothetical protein
MIKPDATDFFGIGNAIRGGVHIYFSGSRQTGRTQSLVNSLKDGDRVIFTTHQEAKRVERLALDRGITISCAVINPKTPETIFEHATSQGRTIFDHSWVEQFYANAIEKAASDIFWLEVQSSGFGEAHRETQRKALEKARWQM